MSRQSEASHYFSISSSFSLLNINTIFHRALRNRRFLIISSMFSRYSLSFNDVNKLIQVRRTISNSLYCTERKLCWCSPCHPETLLHGSGNRIGIMYYNRYQPNYIFSLTWQYILYQRNGNITWKVVRTIL